MLDDYLSIRNECRAGPVALVDPSEVFGDTEFFLETIEEQLGKNFVFINGELKYIIRE